MKERIELENRANQAKSHVQNLTFRLTSFLCFADSLIGI